jgi:hypothetical protein
VTGTVGGSGATVRLTAFAELERLTTESSLIDFALFGARERYTEMFKLADTISYKKLTGA